MIKKLLKFFVIFLVILGISLSNIPFYALSGLIDSYEKTSGIVDKIWLLQNEHQARVVDNFSSLRNLAEKMKVREARAAVSIRNVGAYVSGTSNLTPVIPATAAAGDMMLLAYGTKPYNDAPTINQGWISIGSATDGTVAAGVDVGSMQTRIYYKEHTGSEINPTITNGTNNVSGAVIIVFQKGASEVWETPVGAGGGDATAGTGFSVTASSNPGITSGDMLVGYAAIRSDAGTQSAIGITATGLTVGAFTESPASDLITSSGGDMAMSGGYRLVTAGTASAAPVYASTLAAAHTGSAFIVRLRATTPSYTTTLSNFVSGEPGNSTIAPGASGNVDSFGLATNSGTDTVSAATIGLAAGMGQYIQTIAITNDGDTVTYCSAAPSGDSASLSTCGIPVSTTNTQFKIKLTAKAHVSMPAPDGGLYNVTATVTGFTSGNAQAGTDSGSSTLTIDNDSPAGTTGAGATSGENTQSTVSWTAPGDADFQQVYIYCKTSSMIAGEAPTEGTDPAVDAAACDATARMKYKGTASPQTITGLTNGTLYYFRIYARDTNGNFTAYSATQQVSGTPSAPAATTTLATGTNPGDSTIAPGVAITSVNGFTLTTSAGTDAITAITVNLSTNSGVGTLTITDGADVVLGSIGGGIGTGIVTGLNSISITSTNATTGGTAFKVKVTPLSHANMPAPAGGSYAITGVVTDWTGANTKAGQAADTSSTVTIDNASPANVTAASGTAGDAQVSLSWTNPGDADFDSTVVLSSTGFLSDWPAEGSTYIVGNTIGTATVACVVAKPAASCVDSSVSNGSTYYYQIFTKDSRGNYSPNPGVVPTGDPFTPMPPPPNATSYTNTETGLNNLGGRIGQTITLAGTNFGTVANGNQANCAGGAGTGCLQIGGYTIPDANIGIWSATSIDFSIPSAISVYGTTITVTAASQADATPLNFKVYPDITSISPSGAGEAKEGDTITITGTRFGSTQGVNKVTIDGVAATITGWTDTSISAVVPSAINDANDSVTVRTYQGTEGDNAIYDDSASFVILPKITGTVDVPVGATDAAREYSAFDSDGTFAILGNHFGAAGTVTILGGAATQQATATCSGTAYQVNCAGLRVPDVASYTGDIILTRTADFKSYTYSGFRVLPRIISTAPVNLKGGQGDTVSVAGDHLCQSGTCPGVFSAANSVNFTGGSVTSGSSTWTDTSIPSIVIPGTAADGNLNITSNTSYTSNNLTYDVKFMPATPTNGVPAGQSNIALNPTINSSAFSDGTDGDTHNDSNWEIDEEGTFAAPEWSETLSSANIAVTANNTNGTFAGLLVGQTSLACGKTYSFRERHKDNGGVTSQEWSSWATASTFNTISCGPDATSVSYQVGGDGARSGYSATITGAGFGTVAGGSRANCAGGAGTGCVRFVVGGNATVADADVTAWSDVSISFNVNSTLASEGGALALQVVGAGVSDSSPLNFYVYPTISGYSAVFADGGFQDGAITITGDHLGSSGATTNISFNGTNPASVGVWTSTSISTVDTPNAGADSGTITVTRASDSKASNVSSTFYIYPQITGISAATFADGGYQDGTFTLSGNHLGASAGTISVNGAAQDGTPTWGTSTITGIGISDGGADSGSVALTRSDAKTSNSLPNFYIYPQITSYTASKGDGDVQSATITISGNHFGAGGTGANISVNGVAPSSIGVWGSDSVTTVDIPNAGADSGVITLTNPGTSKPSNNSSTFYIYPQITGISNCENLTGDTAREYSASDAVCPVSGLKDGQIHINGNHFGTPAGTSPLTILGADTSGYASWTASLVSTAQVPITISNSTYTGDIVIKRNDNKTSTAYGANIFRVLPRIASTAPVNLKGGQGDTVSVAGDHLCQSGTCPGVFSAANSVNFTSGSVTSGSSTWTDTSIPSIVIPGTAADGNLNITSNTSYTSNNLTYDIKFSPSTPTNGVPAGQSDVAFNPTINSSAFSDGTDADTHLDSNWEIDEEGTFVTPEWSETLSSANIAVIVNNTNGTFAGLLAGQTALACSKTYSFRERHKDNSGVTSKEWSSWSTASTFNTISCGPDATSISNSTEGTLSDGGRIGQTIVITGTDFSSVTAGNRATCAGGAGTGCVKIGGTGGQVIADTRVTAWSTTSITIQLSLTDLTTTYGGAITNGLMIYVAGVSDTNGLTFYVYPDITSLTAPLGSNTGAREYAADDTDGIFTITGNKFGTGPTGGAAVIVGGTVATFVADGACDAADGWAETCIKVQVPTSISDSTDSGYAIITQGVGTSNKTTNSTDAQGAINIWPRVTGISAATFADGGYQDGTFTLSGNHFGASAGSISVNGAAQDGTPTWGAASITGVGIPNGGADSGNIVLTKSDAKTSNSWSTFYIYPQITGFTAAKGDGDIQTGTITISGNHFGTSGGNAQILINTIAPSATTPTWGAASITNVDIPNTGANSGVIKVTNPQTSKQSNDSSAFYIYPQITSISNCETLLGDTAREYSASDIACPISGLKDGEIDISGNHFGTPAGTSPLTILGADTSGYASWSTALVSASQVPTAIADNSYTGSIALTRNDAKSATYAGFRILPRITSLSPSSGALNTSVTVIGNHLCQAGSASCPGAFSYTTPISNVKFGATNAAAPTIWNWTNGNSSTTGVDVKAPAGSGAVAVKVISGAGSFDYESNTKDFSYVSTAPTDPTDLQQFKSDGSTSISLGGGVNSGNVVLKGDSTALISISMILEVEVKQTYLSFNGTSTVLSSVQGPGTVFNDVAVTVPGLADGQYHWRARAKNSNTSETSNWISFGGNADGVTDFYVDATGPVISSVTQTNVSDIQATITWSTDESSTQQVAYATSCPTAQADAAATFSALTSKQPASPAGSGTSHSVALSGLIASTNYYYMVRSADALGNYSYNPSAANSCNNFLTDPPQTRIMKTLEFYIEQLNTGVNTFSKNFDTFISESKANRSNIFFKSAIVEVFGISKGGSGNITVAVTLNGSSTPTYTLADPGANSVYWTFDKTASSLNFDCVSCTDNATVDNALEVTVNGAASTSLLGAKAIITYYYEPL